MKTMNELQLCEQMEITGGSPLTWLIYIAVGGGIYKILKSSSGRVSIPRFFSLEWRK